MVTQRYMALSDAHGHFHMLWGGYSPKVYDSEFLKMQCQFIKEELAGATVLANNHFKWGKSNFNSMKFVMTVTWHQGCQETGESLATLTWEEEMHNRELSLAHARVENGFGHVATTFDALRQPWHEDEEQQTALVWLTIGITNHHLQ